MAAIDKTYLKRWEDYKILKDWCISIGKVTDDFGNVFKPIDYFFDEHSEDSFNNTIQNQLEKVKKAYDNGDFKWYLDEGIMTQDKYDNFIPFDHINGITVWNTPRFFDVWLIRNCPFDFIQNRLKEQYGGGWSKEIFSNPDENNMYVHIKNKTSVYDIYKRNGLGKNIRINKDLFPVFRRKLTSNIWTHIEIEFNNNTLWYYHDFDYFFEDNDLKNCCGSSSSCYSINKYLPRKTLFRKLQKWDLPEGSIVRVDYIFKYTRKGPTFAETFKLIIKSN